MIAIHNAQSGDDSEFNDTTGNRDSPGPGLNISIESPEPTTWPQVFTKGCFVA
jgi:hypothetical protein